MRFSSHPFEQRRGLWQDRHQPRHSGTDTLMQVIYLLVAITVFVLVAATFTSGMM